MAIDKSIDSKQLDNNLKIVADAIRTKGKTSNLLAFPQDFKNAIENFSNNPLVGQNEYMDVQDGEIIDKSILHFRILTNELATPKMVLGTWVPDQSHPETSSTYVEWFFLPESNVSYPCCTNADINPPVPPSFSYYAKVFGNRSDGYRIYFFNINGGGAEEDAPLVADTGTYKIYVIWEIYRGGE